MPRASVRVLLRTRPAPSQNPYLQLNPDKKGIIITLPKSANDQKSNIATGPGGSSYEFKFDRILHEASQEDVFEAAAVDVLKSALEGYNGTIMCYGQTGAGKTYTMSGGRQSYKQRGLIPRVLSQLFTELRAMEGYEYKVQVSFLEIYNEQMYDLLSLTTQPHEISVHDLSSSVAAGKAGGASASVSVSGLRSPVVASEGEAMALLFEGETNRVIGEHQLNRESSRSHSVFTISLELRDAAADPLGGGGGTLTSKLHLVDLAGSERVSKTRSEGAVLKEAGHINKSLSILEQVILALSEKGRDHVPFRSSRLTHVLKDSLGGNCKTVLVANVWGEASQTEETLSTCRFAQRMGRVTCEITPNVVEESGAKVRALQRQVAELQQELAMHDAMAGRSATSAPTYTPYSEQQRAMLRQQVEQFLASDTPDSIEPIDLISLRHMREVLYCVRSLYHSRLAGSYAGTGAAATAAAASPPPPTQAAAANAGASGGGAAASGTAAAGAAGPKAAGAAADAGAAAAGVGEVDRTSQAGGVGVAPDDLRPWEEYSGNQEAAGPGPGSVAGKAGSGGGAPRPPPLSVGGPSSSGAPPQGPPPDSKAAYESYTAGPGAPKAGLLADNRARLKAARKKAKELGLSINSCKRELDTIKSKADELKAARQARGGDAAQVLDAEELSALGRIKDLKQQYRDQFGELQMVRSEVDYTQQLVDTCVRELTEEFKAWYTQAYGMPAPAGPGVDGDDGLEGILDGPGPGSTAAGSVAGASLYGTGGYSPGPTSPSAASVAPSSVHSYAPSVALSHVSSSAGIPPRASPSPARGAIVGGPPPAHRVLGGGAVGASPARAAATGPSPARRPAPIGAAGPGSGPGRPKVPLASLAPQPDPDELRDPEAAAFYAAQQQLIARTVGVAHRPGSVKKKQATPGPTFSSTQRADITAKVSPDVFSKHAGAGLLAKLPPG